MSMTGTRTRPADMAEWLVAAGTILAILVSVGLTVTVLFRDVRLDLVNLFTIVVGAGAALLAFVRSDNVPMLVIADALLIVGLLPALIGGMWILYTPSLILLVAATFWRIQHPST
jgi:hypothetical protein